MKKLIAVAFLAFGLSAAVGQEAIVNQGTPGTRGPWPVSISGTIAGSSFAVTPQQCTTTANKSTTVGTAAGNTPSSQLAARRYIVLCNSPQNSGTPLVKCRSDGVAPVMAITNPGDVFGIGDCILYPVAASTVIQCIASAASTEVTSFECK